MIGVRDLRGIVHVFDRFDERAKRVSGVKCGVECRSTLYCTRSVPPFTRLSPSLAPDFSLRRVSPTKRPNQRLYGPCVKFGSRLNSWSSMMMSSLSQSDIGYLLSQ